MEFTDANFSGAIFKDEAKFRVAKFTGEGVRYKSWSLISWFGNGSSSQKPLLGKLPPDLSATIFIGKVSTNFRKAKFLGDGGTDFSYATFSGEGCTDFSGTEFSGKGLTNFTFAEFSGKDGTNFNNARFYGDGNIDFSGATFSDNGSTYFTDAQFSGKGKIYFCVTKFSGKGTVDFSRARFSKKDGTNFCGADFSECNVILFTNTIFSENCEFVSARFPWRAHQFVVFQGTRDPIDLSKCSFLYSNPQRLVFHNFKFLENEPDEPFSRSFLLWKRNVVLPDEKKVGSWVTIPREKVVDRQKEEEQKEQITPEDVQVEYSHVEVLYRQFKKNLEEEKNWEDAGEFHYGEMECKRKGLTWFWRNFGLLAWYRYFSGYGERPLRAAISLIILILLCSLLYYISDDSIHYVTYKNLGTVKETTESYHSKGHWLSYSFKAVFWHRFGEYGVEPDSWGKAVFFFESLLGPILIALFILALRRRVKR
ncbi:MAG TPA: pentapeptide repeat-containing protein [Candidatus Avalokitesvara rifleensis]|uniref:pentapeptide repeat-containing protein n=1 Tax=Candidatus Avalokitesvara rifleensis TaxID=3367620 RepID=UPI004026BB81